MPPERGRLEAAYRATGYRLRIDGVVMDLRVDARHPALDRWLESVGAGEWAWLTAWNPGSRPLDADANAGRQARLMARIAATGRTWLGGESIADAGDWPAEASVLVAGLPLAEACALAAEFDQAAILAGRRGEPARLVWID